MDDLTAGALSPLLMAHTDIESDGSSYISYMIFVVRARGVGVSHRPWSRSGKRPPLSMQKA